MLADTEGEHNMKQMPPQMEDKQAHTFLLQGRTVSKWLLQSRYSESIVFGGPLQSCCRKEKASLQTIIRFISKTMAELFFFLPVDSFSCLQSGSDGSVFVSTTATFWFECLSLLLTLNAQLWNRWTGFLRNSGIWIDLQFKDYPLVLLLLYNVLLSPATPITLLLVHN